MMGNSHARLGCREPPGQRGIQGHDRTRLQAGPASWTPASGTSHPLDQSLDRVSVVSEVSDTVDRTAFELIGHHLCVLATTLAHCD